MGYLSKLGAGTMEQLIQGGQAPTPAPAAVRTSAPAEPAGAVPAVQAPQTSTVTATADAPPELAEPQADQNVPQADAPPAPILLDGPASAVPDDAAARQAELDRIAAMNNEDIVAASTQQAGLSLQNHYFSENMVPVRNNSYGILKTA